MSHKSFAFNTGLVANVRLVVYESACALGVLFTNDGIMASSGLAAPVPPRLMCSPYSVTHVYTPWITCLLIDSWMTMSWKSIMKIYCNLQIHNCIMNKHYLRPCFIQLILTLRIFIIIKRSSCFILMILLFAKRGVGMLIRVFLSWLTLNFYGA